MKIKNTNNGITLIALIITIILMLILATVTVNMSINGGLFNYAKNAKDNTEIASEKETIQKALVLAESTSKTGRITVEKMQNAIDKVLGENTALATNFGDSIYVKFKNSQRYYEIDKSQKVKGPKEVVKDTTPGVLDGTGTKEDPFIIMSIEDLVYVSQQTNQNRVSYEGQYIELGRNLDFKSDLSYDNPNTTAYDVYLGGDGTIGLKEQLTNGKGFIPISAFLWSGGMFAGNFNGHNKTIYNINIDVSGMSAGLFGVVNGGKIRNITVTGNISQNVTDSNKGLGGIAGIVVGEGSVLFDCYNLCILNGNGHVGGIAGLILNNNCRVINSCNNGKLKIEGEGEYSSVGGIVGNIGAKITVINCYNLKSIENYNTRVYAGAGGIIGNQTNQEDTIINCYNIGKVTGKYSQGSIVGGYWYDKWISTLEKCYYLENSCGYPVGEAYYEEQGIVTEGTISCTNTYMKSEEFINDLNEYVDTYNEEHKADEDFIALKKWEKGANGYPCFINE